MKKILLVAGIALSMMACCNKAAESENQEGACAAQQEQCCQKEGEKCCQKDSAACCKQDSAKCCAEQEAVAEPAAEPTVE